MNSINENFNGFFGFMGIYDILAYVVPGLMYIYLGSLTYSLCQNQWKLSIETLFLKAESDQD